MEGGGLLGGGVDLLNGGGQVKLSIHIIFLEMKNRTGEMSSTSFIGAVNILLID